MPKPPSRSSAPLKASDNVHLGSALEIVPTLGTFPLIFVDPPFNLDQKYNGYHDLRPDYVDFIRALLDVLIDASDGVLFLHGGDAQAEMYLRMMSDRKMKRIAWVNWHYRFGQCLRSNWIDSRCHGLVYSKYKTWTWNPEDVLVESDRAANNDKRIADSERGGSRVPFTTWGVPSDGPYWGRVQGNSKERRENHPNQLPEKYLERIIRSYSNAGERVLDPCGGSGTTKVVADALGRTGVTVDISEPNVKSILDRCEKEAIRV